MDVKFNEPAPREGLSLMQTALVHTSVAYCIKLKTVSCPADCISAVWVHGCTGACSDESKGKVKVKQSEGETIVNCDGGVGQLGTFGDTAKAAVKAGQWHRIVIAVKCCSGDKSKGDLRTWIDTVPACKFLPHAPGESTFLSHNPRPLPRYGAQRIDRIQRSIQRGSRGTLPLLLR